MKTGKVLYNTARHHAGRVIMQCPDCGSVVAYGTTRSDYYHCKACAADVKNPLHPSAREGSQVDAEQLAQQGYN